MKHTYLIDAGHGGIIDGKYVTAPDKMWEFPDGLTIYEGVRNRVLSSYVMEIATSKNVHVYDVIGGSQLDIPRPIRIKVANEMHIRYKNCVYCSFHMNAGKGTGSEIFTSVGQTTSDAHASLVMYHLKKGMSDLIIRADHSDGDIDKEKDFDVVKKTMCPAWLLELGFMDTREDAVKLLDDNYLWRVANLIVDYFIDVDNNTAL